LIELNQLNVLNGPLAPTKQKALPLAKLGDLLFFFALNPIWKEALYLARSCTPLRNRTCLSFQSQGTI